MLRTNLSTRPFYNERLVSVFITVVAVVAIGVAAVCVQQLITLSARRSGLRAEIARDQAAAGREDTEALALQHAVSRNTLKGLALSTAQANTLIDERTFSWTAFFGLIETALPNDVRVISVAPQIDKDGFVVLMSVVSKRTDDLGAFIDSLQKTGAFYDILPKQEDPTDDGMRRTSVQARYLPPKASAPAPPPTKKGRKP